jgi:hypothetical protein
VLHEKTVTSTKVMLLRVSEIVANGRPNLIPEKIIEGKIAG